MTTRSGNNPCPPGTPGGRVYQAIAGQWQENQRRVDAEHVEPCTMLASSPAPSRAMLPADMQAHSVPQRASARLTAMAPGRRRDRDDKKRAGIGHRGRARDRCRRLEPGPGGLGK